ncbi:hypothetical protein [Luteolibacter luteus]|uniref:DUF4440 domain-containing protein n=1 Tax=Luteolibacter luteus TaxID=2728835 RepID=A0A858RK87_9BACT|nr:hypothetical protein [Luteolibacter luteus]QJE97272.1 hypothetical protein HHL09_16240 [Luteolibacter luteus]
MKRLFLTLLAALIPAFAFADEASATMKQEAEKCAKALLVPDYDAFIVFSHKRIVDGMGGKEKMTATLKQGMEQMKAQGVAIEKVTVGEPGKVEKIDGWMVGLIPQTLLMKVPGGTLEQESHLLGISEDEGKKWVFVDAAGIPKAQLEQIFPEIAGKIEVPARKKPVMKKDEGS